jgi:hypothetical protein
MAKARNEYPIPAGDYGYNLEFTVYEVDQETAFVLTGYTVTLKTWVPGVPGTLLVDGGCTITVAASGTCTYLIQSGDFDTIGRFDGVLQCTKSGVVETSQPVIILVKESAE